MFRTRLIQIPFLHEHDRCAESCHLGEARMADQTRQLYLFFGLILLGSQLGTFKGAGLHIRFPFHVTWILALGTESVLSALSFLNYDSSRWAIATRLGLQFVRIAALTSLTAIVFLGYRPAKRQKAADLEAQPLLPEARDAVLPHEPNGDGSSTSRVYGTIQSNQANGLSNRSSLDGAKGQNGETSDENRLPNHGRSWLSKIKRLRVSRPPKGASGERNYGIVEGRC